MKMSVLSAVSCAVLAFAAPATATDPVLERARHVATTQAAWDAFAAGDFEELAAFYSDDTVLIMPGQTDRLEGRDTLRQAFDSIGEALPPGFQVKRLRYFAGRV